MAVPRAQPGLRGHDARDSSAAAGPRYLFLGFFAQILQALGGEGNDFMSGGSGRDLFSGDNGEDYLVGKKGDDVLEGGARNDTLDGGEGADAFRGGTGRDKVTYANANKTTGDGVTIFWDESAGKLTAKGGEANGDTFDSIEYLLGTSFNDTLVGNPFLFLTGLDLYNTLEGGDGSDLLIGAEVTGDFLIGGRGGDTIDGKSGIDGTTYVTSVGGVYIDLGARVFLLGDAEGDNLISIENVQGSSSNDTIYGDGANNEIDGFIGDDWLSGGGGTTRSAVTWATTPSSASATAIRLTAADRPTLRASISSPIASIRAAR
jgi:Ca2+-binding RTX toxin-like protein